MFKMLYRQKPAPSINDMEETRSKYWAEMLYAREPRIKDEFEIDSELATEICAVNFFV